MVPEFRKPSSAKQWPLLRWNGSPLSFAQSHSMCDIGNRIERCPPRRCSRSPSPLPSPSYMHTISKTNWQTSTWFDFAMSSRNTSGDLLEFQYVILDFGYRTRLGWCQRSICHVDITHGWWHQFQLQHQNMKCHNFDGTHEIGGEWRQYKWRDEYFWCWKMSFGSSNHRFNVHL